mgnify:CR=1 FL=1|jgi:L-rhamnose mutarotase
MVERAFTLTVRKGCYEEYKRAHDELWPEVSDLLNKCNLHMIICYQEPILFLYQVAPSQEYFDRYDNSEINRRWNEYMAKLLETDEQGNIIRGKVEEAFTWGIFKEKNLLK